MIILKYLFSQVLIYYPFFLTVFFTILSVLLAQSLLIAVGILLYFLYRSWRGDPIYEDVIKIKDYMNMDGYNFNIVEGPDKLEDENYIFCSHPHGVFNMSVFLGLLGDYAKFEDNKTFGERYKNLSLRVITLPIFFKLPIISQIMSILGLGSSNREFISELIDLKKSPVVLAGGVHEMLYGGTKKIPVNISRRQGIFKMAKEKGVKIVPIIADNENDNYTYWHLPFNRWLLENFGIIIPISWGKYIIFPNNSEYKIMIGNPIDTNKRTIEEIKEEYIKEIKRIGEKYKLELMIL